MVNTTRLKFVYEQYTLIRARRVVEFGYLPAV